MKNYFVREGGKEKRYASVKRVKVIKDILFRSTKRSLISQQLIINVYVVFVHRQTSFFSVRREKNKEKKCNHSQRFFFLKLGRKKCNKAYRMYDLVAEELTSIKRNGARFIIIE